MNREQGAQKHGYGSPFGLDPLERAFDAASLRKLIPTGGSYGKQSFTEQSGLKHPEKFQRSVLDAGYAFMGKAHTNAYKKIHI